MTAIRIIAILLIIALTGGTIALYSMTLVSWWLPVAVSVIFMAIALIIILKSSHTGEKSRLTWLDKGCITIGAGIIASFMMLGVNYAFADNDSTHTEDAVITQLFKKNHQRYRRTGRGRMIATGETYKSYHIVFAMSDGRTKEQQLTARQYSGLHVGDTYRVNVSDGFLGFPVIKR